MQGKSTITINKRELSVYARITSTDAFSAHPDQTGLLSYFGKVNNTGKLKKVFLVHGEEDSMNIFAEKIKETGFEEVVIPKRAEAFMLD
jgi:metallo-beta-lactamase family protein